MRLIGNCTITGLILLLAGCGGVTHQKGIPYHFSECRSDRGYAELLYNRAQSYADEGKHYKAASTYKESARMWEYAASICRGKNAGNARHNAQLASEAAKTQKVLLGIDRLERDTRGGEGKGQQILDGPILIVSHEDDSRHRTYRTLSHAIKNAHPGTLILVRPGLYRESIIIDKRIEIVGDGPRDKIIVESLESDCILMKADRALVRGLTLRCRTKTKGSKCFGVHIPTGLLVLEDCGVTSDSLACIGIHGDSADPVIRGCTIYGGKQHGVYIYDNGGGTVEDCDIFGNGDAGIAIRGDSYPVIRRCRIHDGKRSGIFVYERGRGIIEDCDVFRNALAGLEIEEEAHPVIRGCRFHYGKQGGVYIHNNGRGTIEDCDIFGNAYAGVAISGGGDPVIRKCAIHDGKQSGVYVYNNGRGTIEDCDIFGNAYSEIIISGGGDPVIRKCAIHDGKQSGVYVYDNSKGTVEDCDISGNAYAGVIIREGSNPVIRNCAIHDGKQSGVYVYDNGEGTIEGCSISGNAYAGVAIGKGGNPVIHKCTIRRNRDKAVRVYKNGQGTLESCHLTRAYSGCFSDWNCAESLSNTANSYMDERKYYKAASTFEASIRVWKLAASDCEGKHKDRAELNAVGTEILVDMCRKSGGPSAQGIKYNLLEVEKKKQKILNGPTLIVSQEGDGRYRTISEAIRSARPGTLIMVRPGWYKEGLIIDKEVGIVGDGPRDKIIVESSESDCVLMKTDYALVRGLTLRCRAGIKGKEYFGVNIPGGGLLLENCNVTSDSLACIAVHGAVRRNEAWPVIRKCTIHDGKQSGVYIYDNGEAMVEDCDILENGYAGVEITEGGYLIIRKCKIYDGEKSGIYFHKHGRGMVEDCNIFRNALAGVEIEEGADPIIRKCKIHDSKQSGVYVHDNGKGTVEDCDIFKNALSGVTISEGGNPVIRKCTIHDGKQSGVYIYDNGKGTVEDCDISENAYAGIIIREGGNPVIRKSSIHNGKEGGILVYDNGGGTAEECDIFKNALAGIEISTGGRLVIHKCRIHHGEKNGVYVHDNGGAIVELCDIFNNAHAGIEIEEGADPIIRKCRIHEGGKSGVYVHKHGGGTVEDCKIFNNADSGVEIRESGDPIIRRCRIDSNGYNAVRVYKTGRGTVESCRLKNNKRGPWGIESENSLIRVGNKL